MTEYVRVWGGLPTGSHIHELNLLSSLLPSDRIVSGSFFRWLTSLRHSFSVENMPSHFINAVLYCHAASNEGVVDDFARFISKGDVMSFGSKSKAAPRVQRVIDTMLKLRSRVRAQEQAVLITMSTET